MKVNDVVIYKSFGLDVAQGHMNGAPNETKAHSWSSLMKLVNHFTTWEWCDNEIEKKSKKDGIMKSEQKEGFKRKKEKKEI